MSGMTLAHDIIPYLQTIVEMKSAESANFLTPVSLS
jgi:hypothetical protein